MGIKLKFLGGAQEVGKQGILAQGPDVNLLLDYGSIVSSTEPKFPEHVRPSDVNAVILSHAHLDHSGALPYLYVSGGPEVFMTPPTLDLSRLLLKDFLHISGEHLPYEALDVESMTRKTELIEYGESITRDKFELCVRDAGHIPGSMITSLQLDSKKISFTGDLNIGETRLVRGADTSDKEADVVIMEGTYSDKDHPPRSEMEEELVSSCREIVESGGVALVPAFSVGRSHEIVSVLRGRGFNHQVYLDGMAREAAEIIMSHPSYLRDGHEFEKAMGSVTWVNGWRERKQAVSSPGVVVSPAGMLRGGAAAFYIERLAFSKKNGVFVVSYQAENTPGRMMLETGELYFKGQKRKVEAKIHKFDFSSHAGKSELEGYIKSFKGSPSFCLVHGEANSLTRFAAEMAQSTGLKVHAPSIGETLEF